MNQEYDYEFKVSLANRINNIKKKEYLAKIFKIISPEENTYTENSYGILVEIQNLSDEKYEKLFNYLNYISN